MGREGDSLIQDMSGSRILSVYAHQRNRNHLSKYEHSLLGYATYLGLGRGLKDRFGQIDITTRDFELIRKYCCPPFEKSQLEDEITFIERDATTTRHIVHDVLYESEYAHGPQNYTTSTQLRSLTSEGLWRKAIHAGAAAFLKLYK
jgi:hypothetical protein